MGQAWVLASAVCVAIAACGGGDPAPVTSDAPPVSTGCTTESDCTASAPYCEPASGTCVSCRFTSHCGDSICEANTCRAARTCQELKTALPTLTSGIYQLAPDDGEPFDAYCEMTIDGGGWTLVQRTVWSWTASQALSTGFVAWHDEAIGAPAPGNAYRMPGKHWTALASGGDVMVAHRLRTTAGGACNPLYYVGTGGTLTLDGVAKTVTFANVTQAVPIINGPDLSTTDSGPSTTCVAANLGVPWFYTSCCSTCPTFGGGYWADEPHPMQSYTATADVRGQTETTACAGQAIQLDVNGGHRGVDSMEMYLR